MAVYFVMHPNIEYKATVDAPSTEKARTVYLDYLERQKAIDRASRQSLRRNLVASKIDDPNEVRADIHLSYGYTETQHPQRESMRDLEELAPREVEPVYETSYTEEPRQVESFTPVQEVQPQVKARSPIEQISLGDR